MSLDIKIDVSRAMADAVGEADRLLERVGGQDHRHALGGKAAHQLVDLLLRTDIEAAWFHGFTKDFIFSITGSAGYVAGWAGDDVRINDRYYKGGLTFRGFETAGIGPRDTSLQRADALGGKAYAITTVELTVPTFLPEQYGIKAALFSVLADREAVEKVFNIILNQDEY